MSNWIAGHAVQPLEKASETALFTPSRPRVKGVDSHHWGIATEDCVYEFCPISVYT